MVSSLHRDGFPIWQPILTTLGKVVYFKPISNWRGWSFAADQAQLWREGECFWQRIGRTFGVYLGLMCFAFQKLCPLYPLPHGRGTEFR